MEIRGDHLELMLLRGVEKGAVVVAEGDKEATEVRVIMSSCLGGSYASGLSFSSLATANVQNKDER